MNKGLKWIRVSDKDVLPENRVKTVSAGHKSLCLTHYKGKYAALDNKCPHQGGPLGEGSIEDGMLRCPWHGWDFDPITGKPPGGYDDGVDTFPVEEREDGIYVALKAEDAHVRTVSDVMAETMVNWGIKDLFGMVGHSCLGLADAIRRQEESGRLRFFSVRHEGAAAFAASGYAKLTGKPAACLTIAGPGATNLLTGLWDAKVDRAPILALTGQVNTQVVGPGAFQEVDLSAAFSSVANFSQPVLNNSNHAELMTLAVKRSLLDRDVSHLIFPDEVQTVPAKESPASSPQGRITAMEIAPPVKEVDRAVKLLKKAKRPAIICGHGARFHRKEIVKFAESANIPVITTFKGKGIVSDHHPLGCGVLGRSGTPIASWFMNESDLLLVMGASFSDHTGITPKKPTIQIDFDANALGKTHPVDVLLWGEIGTTLEILKSALSGKMSALDHRKEIEERWKIWRSEKKTRESEDSGNGVNSASIFSAMNRHIPANAAVSVDVGNNTYSFGRYFECQEQSIIMSGYLGSIGFGFPAAMGAWAAQGDQRPIVAVTGDGGFGQYLGEVLTAVQYKMNITHILLNNSQIGKISKEQRAGQFDVWKTKLHNPNFSEYANHCGALGIRVTESNKLDDAIQKALEYNGPSLVEIISDPDLI